MHGDGDGWVVSATGDHYWGRFGAAGLLLRAPRPDGTPAVLLQHRAAWSHQGGTWALPGGARDSHETPEETALREAEEEASVDGSAVRVRASLITAEVLGANGPCWSYTTVIADADEPVPTVPNKESSEMRWVAEDEVSGLALHPGFAASWHRLRTTCHTVALDSADQRRRQLPRTLEVETGTYLWCIAGGPVDGDPGVALTPFETKISSLLSASR